jgi:hypothetical protein
VPVINGWDISPSKATHCYATCRVKQRKQPHGVIQTGGGSTPNIRGKSRMQENCTCGSVGGAGQPASLPRLEVLIGEIVGSNRKITSEPWSSMQRVKGNE